MKFIYFYLAMYLSILIHEYGHFFWFRKYGVRIYQFDIGVGPTLFKKRIKDIDFTFKLFPIMGYVKQEEQDVNRISFWKAGICILAGVLNNLFLFFFFLLCLAKFNFFKFFNVTFGIIIPSVIKLISNFDINILVGPQNSMNSVYNSINISGVQDAFILFAAVNLSFFVGNIIPIPALDGGQLVILLLRRLFIKLGFSEKLFDKIANPVCWISFVLLTGLFIFNELLATGKALVYFIYIIMMILIAALILVVKQTDYYKLIFNKGKQ